MAWPGENRSLLRACQNNLLNFVRPTAGAVGFVSVPLLQHPNTPNF